MARWKDFAAIGLLAALMVPAGSPPAGATLLEPQAPAAGALSPAYLDQLLAPVALYPDQLLAQMLLCAGNPSMVGKLGKWLKEMATLKGSALQEAANKAGFEPSFVALAPFPQVVELMAGNLTWTSQLGGAFTTDRVGGVRQHPAAAHAEPGRRQPEEHPAADRARPRPRRAGEQVIVIEPANPQVVYVPQYNPQVVYTQTAPTTVVVQDDDDDEAAAAVIGFAAGIAIGAAIDNDYYYGPYGWRGGAYMHNDGWDDWYDDREDAREDYYENREDAREDWQDNREDMAGERSERAEDAREQRGTPEAQAQRDERRTEAQGKAQQARSTGATPERSAERSGTRSDAFSGYSSGSSTRSASSRGERSRSSRSGGGRSRR